MSAAADKPRRNPTGQSTGPSLWKVPAGDDRERLVCADCGFIHYENPKIVVGAVALWDGKVLLCRRAIEPRRGFWTVPAGYMEARETTFDGAKREAWEEAGARIEIEDLFAVYNIPRISQVHMFFRARLVAGEFAPGPESLEARLFAWDEVPYAELAFPTTRWALDHYRELIGATSFAVRTNPAGASAEIR
jgi:ADP-ribose pyrophosphatase YjhB (NUDIX family)